MKIVLFQPEIPQNTGTIARTCAATATGLVLVRPLGFSTSSRQLKRAGLDYWDQVSIEEIDDLPSYLQGKSFLFFSSKAKKIYTEAPYTKETLLIFGSETGGLSEEFWEKWPEAFYTIPMVQGARCINLACSANVVLYEALRQTHFEGLKSKERTKDKETLARREVARGI